MVEGLQQFPIGGMTFGVYKMTKEHEKAEKLSGR